MRAVQWYSARGVFWFRVFGWGLHIKDTAIHPLVFSERVGTRRKLMIGALAIGLLPPD
jgi:hypothetical protein